MESYLIPVLVVGVCLLMLFLLAYSQDLKRDPIGLFKALLAFPIGMVLLFMDIIAGRGEEESTFE